MERPPTRHRRLGRLAAIAIALAAMTVSACDATAPDDGLVIVGGGDGVSAPFDLPAGAYLVRWRADGGDPAQRCMVGITIEPDDAGAVIVDGSHVRAVRRKLVYEAIGSGDRAGGDVDGVALLAGTYRLRSEGTCGWQVEILPGLPGPTHTPGIDDGEESAGGARPWPAFA